MKDDMPRSNLTTLCYIERDNKYLMLHRVKKEHDINKDKWVGIGGHFEKDESPEECLLREVREETGLILTDYRLRGIITFISDKWQTEYMFLYTASDFEGAMHACDEGELEWVEKSEVYNLPIWEGDKVFFRLLEKNEPFFSLKLRYEGEELVENVLNGKTTNTVTVKLQEVLEALEGAGMETNYYYDTKHQRILMVFNGMVDGEENPELLEDICEGFTEDYIPLPGQYEIHEYRMMEDFIDELPGGRAQNALASAIRGRGAFRRFKDRVYDFDLQDQWFRFRDACYERVARDWCEKWGIGIEE